MLYHGSLQINPLSVESTRIADPRFTLRVHLEYVVATSFHRADIEQYTHSSRLDSKILDGIRRPVAHEHGGEPDLEGREP